MPKEIATHLFSINLKEGQPQASISMDLLGNDNQLIVHYGVFSKRLEDLGFKFISMDQSRIEGGIHFKSIFLIPSEGGLS